MPGPGRRGSRTPRHGTRTTAVSRSAGARSLCRLVTARARIDRGTRRLVSETRDTERRERHADLAERFDRDEEAQEQEHDRQELADLEIVRDAESVQRITAAGHEATDRDEDRRRHPAMQSPTNERRDGAG